MKHWIQLQKQAPAVQTIGAEKSLPLRKKWLG
jgi:hypothetical protein